MKPSECPSFWCSKCVKDHPGECPPEPTKKSYPPGFTIELRDCTVDPVVGSKWLLEDLDFATGKWVPRATVPGLYFEVMSVAAPDVMCNTIAPGLTPWLQSVPLAAFTSEGFDNRSFKVHWRMVPKP